LVSFVFCKAPFAPLKHMTARATEWLQYFEFVMWEGS
jgi:hypothetical protein